MILPLKLGWEPFYLLPEGVTAAVGDRVRVSFAGRRYLGVVSQVGVNPPDSIGRVVEIFGVDESKEAVLASEIAYWRMLAEYYMCTVGEIYKAAYPYAKDESVVPRKKDEEYVPMKDERFFDEALVQDGTKEFKDEMIRNLSSGRPLLLNAVSKDRERLLAAVCRHFSDGNVLWLVPEMKLGNSLQERMKDLFGSRLHVWGAGISPSRRRTVLRKMRKGEPYILLGTRSALFLPHTGLSLVIVQDEHDVSYKQTSPAPRYNGRDSALLLASMFNAPVLLESPSPSLESLFNALKSKYFLMTLPDERKLECRIVDTRAEMKKNGMIGDVPKALIAEFRHSGGGMFFYKPRRAAFPKFEELQAGISAVFQGEKGFEGSLCISEDLVTVPVPEGTRTLVIFGLDSMLGRYDFRADERAFQTVVQAVAQSPRTLERLIVLSREPSHPVFAALKDRDETFLLEERRSFSYPPFTRMIDIQFKDSFPDRIERMEGKLIDKIQDPGICSVIPMQDRIRLLLKKDSTMRAAKRRLSSVADEFEREEKYPSHISFDVDPC